MKHLCSQAAATFLCENFPCSYSLFISRRFPAFCLGMCVFVDPFQAFPSSTTEPRKMNLSLVITVFWVSVEMIKNKQSSWKLNLVFLFPSLSPCACPSQNKLSRHLNNPSSRNVHVNVPSHCGSSWLVCSRWTISPACCPPGLWLQGFLPALGWWWSLMVNLVLEPKPSVEGQQQLLKLSPSTTELQFTAGKHSFRKFPLAGRWKTHLISWRLGCSLCLLRAVCALLASSSPLPPPFFGTEFLFRQHLPCWYHQRAH